MGGIEHVARGVIVDLEAKLPQQRKTHRGNEAGIAVGKGHNKKMRPMLDPGDDRIRLAKAPWA